MIPTSALRSASMSGSVRNANGRQTTNTARSTPKLLRSVQRAFKYVGIVCATAVGLCVVPMMAVPFVLVQSTDSTAAVKQLQVSVVLVAAIIEFVLGLLLIIAHVTARFKVVAMMGRNKLELGSQNVGILLVVASNLLFVICVQR